MDGRLAIIGSGRMGEALLGGLLRTGAVAPPQVMCTDVDPGRRREIEAAHGVSTHDDNRAAVAGADVVLLAVKPQSLDAVLAGFGETLGDQQTVVSIVAGVPTSRIEQMVPPGVPVVRVMPNTPALVDEGMSIVAGGRHAEDVHLALAEELLGAVGEVVRLPEEQVDAATAISGSGPAYVFLLGEALMEAGVHLGLSRDVATRLVTQTLRGSATLLRDGDQHPAQLREAVTSPGGVTAAALARFEAGALRSVVLEAVTAARDRAGELGAG